MAEEYRPLLGERVTYTSPAHGLVVDGRVTGVEDYESEGLVDVLLDGRSAPIPIAVEYLSSARPSSAWR